MPDLILFSLFLFCVGFGSQYDWLSLDDGLKEAKDNGKPVMVLIHKSWCGACKGNKIYPIWINKNI